MMTQKCPFSFLRGLALLLTLAVPATSLSQYRPEGLELSELTPPSAGENAQAALAQIQQNVDKIKTLKATLVMDARDPEEAKKKKAKKKKAAKAAAAGKAVAQSTPNPKYPKEPDGRRVKSGPVEITRGAGAHLVLNRKASTDEYVANRDLLWSYDHNDKEAKYVSSSMPVIRSFAEAAFNLNTFVAMDMDTVKLRGSQSVNGEPCWFIEGKSPEKLGLAGIDPTTIRYWVSKKDGVPRLIKIPSDDDTQIVLKNVSLNAQTDPSQYLNWQPPQGVKRESMLGL